MSEVDGLECDEPEYFGEELGLLIGMKFELGFRCLLKET